MTLLNLIGSTGTACNMIEFRIAEIAKLPTESDVARAAMRFHHMSQNYRGEGEAIVQCVEVANVICTLKDITSVGRKLVLAPTSAMAALGLAKDDIKVLAEDLDRELELNESLFEL